MHIYLIILVELILENKSLENPHMKGGGGRIWGQSIIG